MVASRFASPPLKLWKMRCVVRAAKRRKSTNLLDTGAKPSGGRNARRHLKSRWRFPRRWKKVSEIPQISLINDSEVFSALYLFSFELFTFVNL